MAVIVAKGDKITAAIGAATAAVGAFGLSQWSMIIGIFCTLSTFVITNVVNVIYKKKALAVLKENIHNPKATTAFLADEEA
ncbi:HP1 family phage holin [Aliivibrio fischeri]|uniref:HP1 family phage holin n=1 Tax=Aliivibrio fischeri TaxID=668 RepID=UPI001BDED411|nr:HP1 family phage holin [Aliivibrio fischeri]